MLKAVVNLNGVEQVVKVDFYHEGDSRRVYITIYNEFGTKFRCEDEASGGNDEYGYEYTADDLAGFLESYIAAEAEDF